MNKLCFHYAGRAVLAVLFLLPATASYGYDDVLRHIQDVYRHAIDGMLSNVSPPGARAGVVVAAAAHHGPNYFKHWVRDAGIVMNVMVTLYQVERDPVRKAQYRQHLFDWINFERANQQQPTLSRHHGEPFFWPDGTVALVDWGRPQMDSPALRTIAAIRWAQVQLAEGNEHYVRTVLYDGKIPAQSLIKADLEAIVHGGDFGYDLWEEVLGLHFYTRRVQRKALVLGALLAERLGDEGAAFYRAKADERARWIDEHWDWEQKYLWETRYRLGGVDTNETGRDSAVILGMNHGDTYEIDGQFPVYDDRALATAWRLEQDFRAEYPLNRNLELPGVAMGRYRRDVWNGYDRTGIGHPWFVTTNGFAEYYARVAAGLDRRGYIQITPENFEAFAAIAPSLQETFRSDPYIRDWDSRFRPVINALAEKARDFVRRSLIHGGVPGPFTELYSRESGERQGVQNLTWSCASLITAAQYTGLAL